MQEFSLGVQGFALGFTARLSPETAMGLVARTNAAPVRAVGREWPAGTLLGEQFDGDADGAVRGRLAYREEGHGPEYGTADFSVLDGATWFDADLYWARMVGGPCDGETAHVLREHRRIRHPYDGRDALGQPATLYATYALDPAAAQAADGSVPFAWVPEP